MRYCLLGPLEVAAGGRRIDVGQGKRRAVLALLLLHRNEVVPADRLIEELWEKGPPATATKRLQVCVSQLRHEIAQGGGDAGALRTAGGGYELRVGDGELDIVEFDQAVPAARRHLEAGRPDAAAKCVRQALALWRGPPLADFEYERFAQAEIARLEEQRLALVEAEMDAELALGRHAEVVGALEHLVDEYPLHERFSAQLMLALYRSGRQADALGTYRRLRGMLDEDLGLQPMPELREMEESVLQHDRSLDAPRRGEPIAPTVLPDLPPRTMAVRRVSQLLIVGGAVLAGAGALAVIERDRRPAASLPIMGTDRHLLAALDRSGRHPQVVFPLPGHPTGIAQGGRMVWVTTTNPPMLTEIASAPREITRIVPLAGRADAVATTAGIVWVLDSARGRLTRIATADATVASVVAYRRSRPGGDRGHSALATTADAVWVSDGGPALFRVSADARRVVSLALGTDIDDIAVRDGSVWALSATTGRVARVDADGSRVAEWLPVAGVHPAGIPFPAYIAASASGIWTLCGRRPTLTQIDPRRHRSVATVQLPGDRVPVALVAGDGVVWVADRGGELTRIVPASGAEASRRVGQSLERLALVRGAPWVTTD